MPLITSLISRLQSDFPQYHFIEDKTFQWSPADQTIYYNVDSNDQAALLHELAHALLGHTDYDKDIQLIEMERDAWEYARTLTSYDVTVSEDVIQESLDTYRDWLHARSTCPNCHATGMQTKKSYYKCISCSTEWRVNEARVCALRRYKVAI